jgi:hypothetical protein
MPLLLLPLMWFSTTSVTSEPGALALQAGGDGSA